VNSIRNQGLFVAGLVLAMVPWLLAPSTISPFLVLYGTLNVRIPAATRLLIDYPQGLLALPLFVLAVWCYPGWKARRGKASLSAGLAASAIGYLLIVTLLYWPTFVRSS